MRNLIGYKKRSSALGKKRRKSTLLLTFLGIAILALIPSWRMFFLEYSKFVPTSGGIFTEATIGETRNINPLASNASVFDKDLHTLLYSGLLEYNPISGQIEPALASFRVSEDGLEYIATLKDSAVFSNGDPVTAEDILFTYETVIKNPGFKNIALSQKFEYVQIEKTDEKTIRFILPEPNAYFPFVLTTPILHARSFPVSFVEEVVDPHFSGNKHPVGTGPFILKNIIAEQDGVFRVFLKKNKHYFKKNPYVNQIVLYVYPDAEYLKISHNWPTMISKIPPEQSAAFQEAIFGQYTVREYLLPRFLGVFFNLDKPFVSNLLFRNALTFSTNKERLLKDNPGWEPINSLLFFEGIDSWQEYDIREAKKLLKQSKVSFDSDESLKLITGTLPPVYSRFAQALKNTFQEELDIPIDLEALTPEEFDVATTKRDYDMVLFGQDFSENAHSLSLWHSSQNNKINLSNLTNEKIDFLINEITLTGAKSDLFLLGQKLNDLAPAIPIATPKYNLFVSPDLKGFSDSFGKVRHHSQRFFGIESWYFKEKRIWNLPKKSNMIAEFFQFLFRPKDRHEEISPEPTPES